MTYIVSLSGGMDSTAALYRTQRRHRGNVVAVAIDYGQRHRVELDHSLAVANRLKVLWRVIDLKGILSGSSLLGEGEVPHGHYAAATMTATVVNGRNLLFASALIAQAKPGDTVVLGVHAGDHHIYADCRPEFVTGLRACAAAYDVTISTPWLYSGKHDIITAEPNAPYALTWSCYEGGEVHCGKCGTCVERIEAFALSGKPDPTTYA